MTTDELTEVLEFPASATQASIFIINQFDPDSLAYNIPMCFRLKGNFDHQSMRRALREMINRHEILRTVYALYGADIVQRVLSDVQFELPLIDMSKIETENKEQQLKDAITEASQNPFDLIQGPVIRCHVIKADDGDHLLLINIHHIAFDHSAVGLLMGELNTFYTAFSRNEEVDIEEPGLQYVDYVVWLEERFTDEELDAKVDLWCEKLQPFSGVLDLPSSYPRPAAQTYAGADYLFQFDTEVSETIRNFSKKNGVSLFTTLISALKILLHRLSGQDDIIIGTPFTDRLQDDDLNGVLGCFINALPIATYFNPDLNYTDIITEVKKTLMFAFANQEAPLVNIVSKVAFNRDPSYNPLFQVGFVFQEPPIELTLDDLDAESVYLECGGSMYDLHFWLWEENHRIAGSVRYNTDTYNEEHTAKLVATYKLLISQLMNQPTVNIHQLAIVGPSEQTKLMVDYNNTACETPDYQSVVQLIANQVQLKPDAIAIKTSESQLSYGELHQRSILVAHKLIAEGVEAGQFVAVCMERRQELLVVLMAIWKCGAAYLPVDPGFPSDRVQYILEHSKVSLVITESQLEESFEAGVRKIIIDQLDYSGEHLEEIDVVFDPEAPAYVIYTSGSTGQPKGVVNPHRAVINFIHSMAKIPGLTAQDKLLAITTLSFDIHVLELWLPLTVGATIMLASREQAASGIELAEIIDNENVTVMQATPSTWNLLLASEWQGKTDLKALVGGEAAAPELIKNLLPKLGALWNMYGPTETTVWSTCHQVTADDEQLLIGKPIDNTQFYVLDDAEQLVPHNVEGQLYIGGMGLSLGYLYNGQETANAFVKVKLPDGEIHRLYKTGDLVVVNENGQLRYIRRSDNQVKVRGFRIELGEIESAIADLEEVASVIVIVREDRPGDKRIVAYFVPQADTSLTITEMRSKLKDKLPAYMIPQYLVSLQKLPLTPNGKYDKKVLPAPYDIYDASQDHKEAAESESEKLIAGLWESLLQCEQVGRNDNFFEIGGHSLLSMNFINEIRMSIGAQLTPRDIVLNDLAQLATKIDEQKVEVQKVQEDVSNSKPKRNVLRRMIDRFK